MCPGFKAVLEIERVAQGGDVVFAGGPTNKSFIEAKRLTGGAAGDILRGLSDLSEKPLKYFVRLLLGLCFILCDRGVKNFSKKQLQSSCTPLPPRRSHESYHVQDISHGPGLTLSVLHTSVHSEHRY